MKMNLLKKMSAVATTVAMLGTLGMTALAAPSADSAWPKDYEVANAMDITDVKATYYVVNEGQSSEYNDYTITIKYTCASTAQVTVLGYLYEGSGGIPESAPALGDSDTASIYAVNQQAAGNGTATIKLIGNASATKHVNGDEMLVIKMGTDDTAYSAAQAVMVNLANSVKTVDPIVPEATTIATDEVYADYGTAWADITLPAQATVSGNRNGAAASELVDVAWNKPEGKLTAQTTVNGTITLDESIFEIGEDMSTAEKEALTKVSVTVKWNSLDMASAVQEDVTVNVPQGADADDVTALIKAAKVGLKLDADSAKVQDVALTNATVDISAYTGNEDVDATVAVTATITSYGTEGTDVFVLAGEGASKTFNITLKIVLGVTYGDVTGDGNVNMQDVAMVLKAAMRKVELTDAQKTAANVNGDTAVNMQDVALVLKKAMRKLDKFPVEQ